MRRGRIKNPRHFFLNLKSWIRKWEKKRNTIKVEAVLEEGGDRAKHVLVTKERKL